MSHRPNGQPPAARGLAAPNRRTMHCNPARRCALGLMALGLAWLTSGCSTVWPDPPRGILRIVSVSEWGGQVVAPASPPQTLHRLTVHHQGEVWRAGGDVPAYLRRLQKWSQEARGWADIPYHFIVAPDGAVYAARPVSMAGDTNTDYDPSGHLLVMLLGNFEVQTPTAAQWQSTVEVMAQGIARHGLQRAAIGTHRQHATQTVCPGANLEARFDALREEAITRSRQLEVSALRKPP